MSNQTASAKAVDSALNKFLLNRKLMGKLTPDQLTRIVNFMNRHNMTIHGDLSPALKSMRRDLSKIKKGALFSVVLGTLGGSKRKKNRSRNTPKANSAKTRNIITQSCQICCVFPP